MERVARSRRQCRREQLEIMLVDRRAEFTMGLRREFERSYLAAVFGR